MKNTMRFATQSDGVRKTTVLEWSDILSGNHEGLVDAKRMLPYLQETKAKEALYEGDILSLKATDVSEQDGFWGSGVGSKMKERGFDEFVVHLSSKDHEPLTANLYAIKDGEAVRDSLFYDYEAEENKKDDIWSETGADMLFIRYFIAKGATLLGNDWEHPELIEKFLV